MGYSEDRDAQRIADGWTLKVRGLDAPIHSIGGKIEADRLRSYQTKSEDISSFPSSPSTFSTPTYTADPIVPNLPRQRGPRLTNTSRPHTSSRGGGPLFPSVDSAFEKTPGAVYVVLMVIGALCGLAASAGSKGGAATVLGNILAGAFAGLILIPALKTAVKAVLAALAIGLTALVLYLMFQAAK